MSSEIRDMDANMDPWCTVALGKSDCVLFGFATRHHRTGGLARPRSSLLVALDESRRWARTFSGTLFHSGEQFQVDSLADYGTEALLAFKLLCDESARPDHLTPLLQTREMGEIWLTACKVARHADLAPPRPVPDETIAFLRENGPKYAHRRALLRSCAGTAGQTG